MRFIACCIDASLQDSPFPFGVSRPPKSVRDWSGILCELFGIWGRGRDAGTGIFSAGTGCGKCRIVGTWLAASMGTGASKDIAESPTA